MLPWLGLARYAVVLRASSTCLGLSIIWPYCAIRSVCTCIVEVTPGKTSLFRRRLGSRCHRRLSDDVSRSFLVPFGAWLSWRVVLWRGGSTCDAQVAVLGQFPRWLGAATLRSAADKEVKVRSKLFGSRALRVRSPSVASRVVAGRWLSPFSAFVWLSGAAACVHLAARFVQLLGPFLRAVTPSGLEEACTRRFPRDKTKHRKLVPQVGCLGRLGWAMSPHQTRRLRSRSRPLLWFCIGRDEAVRL